jgi:hypothetical protein
MDLNERTAPKTLKEAFEALQKESVENGTADLPM